MKRICRLSTLAGVTVVAACLLSLTPVSHNDATAGPYFPLNGRTYYGSGYAPGYRGYSGYSPYGGGGYTYYAPRTYVYPTYRSEGFGTGYGGGGIYYGGSYGGSRFYGQPYRPSYSPYGYGGYGPYGY